MSNLQSKAQATRAHIIRQAAAVFNQQGYAGTSMADIMAATGLQKGGLYNHFKSKDELALAAFDYSAQLVQEHYRQALQGKRHAGDRLAAVVNAFCDLMAEPPVRGGCPILNTAIDSDDGHPELRQRAKAAMNAWRGMLRKIVVLGIGHGQIDASASPDAVTTVVIATLEGGLMQTQLYGSPVHLDHARQHLLQYLQGLRAS